MNWDHFIALIRLRFQLSLNQIRKGGSVNSILFMIAFVGVIAMALMSFVFAIFYGALGLQQHESSGILLTWNVVVLVFLGSWILALVNRIQQTDVISIDKLLHLPISFHGAFLLNYVSTLANLTLLMFAPVMIGLAIGMPWARGPASAIAIPLTFTFLFMVTAVTFQFRGWMAEKMKNKRTKGILVAVIPLALVFGILSISETTDSSMFKAVVTRAPLGWLPGGIMQAETGNWTSGVLGSLAMTLIGGTSLYFSYKTSMRKFTGQSKGRNRKTQTVDGGAKAWLESTLFKSLPMMTEPVSGVALSGVRSMRRAPEAFAAIIPALAVCALGSPYLLGMEGYVIPDWIKIMLPIGLIGVTLIGFPAFLFSTFSYDRDGFRAYILSPIERRDILLGKNLAIGIPTLISGWLMLSLLQVFVPIGLFWFFGGLVQVVAAYWLVCISGNVISIYFPVGLKRGSMQPVNARVIPMVALYFGIFVAPMIAMMPTTTSFGIARLVGSASGLPMGWLYLLLSFLMLALSIVVYKWSLGGLGRSLWQQESKILDVVANIPE